MPLLDRYPWLSYALRRAVAFAIDFEIVQILSHALLNLADLPLPTWALSLFMPVVFAGYSLVLLARGPEARTFGKHLMGLAVRSAAGGRPSAGALVTRTATLALLLFVNWGSLLSGAMGDPLTFGRVLAVSVAVGIATVSLAAVRQIQSGAWTPHDAIAETRVERLGSSDPYPVPAGQPHRVGLLAAVVMAVLVASIFVIEVLTVTRNTCSPCRIAERQIASRYQMPSRVDMTVWRDVLAGGPRRLQTTVWLPALSSSRADGRNGALRLADSLATQVARYNGLELARPPIQEELTQAPFILRMDDSSGVLSVGIGGPLSVLETRLALNIKFKSVPVVRGPP
jgi:RDD family protein